MALGPRRPEDAVVRFGEFELDVERAQLSCKGVPLKLQPQPMRMLQLLIARAPAAVSREELGEHIWGKGVHIDLEQNLNYCIRQIRLALDERADQPRFVETLPRQGYRFAGVVKREADDGTATPGMSRRAVLWTVAGGGGVLAAGAAGWLGRSLWRGPRPQAMEVAIPIPQGAMAVDPGRLLGAPSVAPDGSAIVVSLHSDTGNALYIRRLDSARLVRMVGTEDGVSPFWSPDSQNVGFFSGGSLKRIPAAGGSAVTLCEAPEPRGGSWGAAGTILFATNLQGLYRVPESGGAPVAVTQLDHSAQENSHRYPVFLPDGERFLYFARADDMNRRGIYLSSLQAPRERRRLLVADGWFALGMDPQSAEHYVVSQQAGTFVAQRLDTRTGTLVGAPQTLLELSGTISLSNTGVLVARREWQLSTRLVWVDRAGRELGTIGDAADYWSLRLSPDDRFAAVTRHDFLSGEFRLWTATLPGTLLEPLSEANHVSRPVWSGDSRVLYYTDFRQNTLLRRRVSPRGAEEQARALPPETYLISISDDDRYGTVEFATDRSHRSAAWTEFRSGPELGSRHVLETTGEGWPQPMFSPDSRWVALSSNRSGRAEIYVADAVTGARLRVSTQGGREPRWRADGREIFYLAPDDSVMAVPVEGEAELSFGAPQRLFQRNLRMETEGPLYDVTRDGQRFLVIEAADQVRDSNLSMIVNWPSRLRS